MEQELLDSELFKHGNISLILNSYNDIFSSFDPRPFSEKALSDDFLIECKRAARDKDEFGIELILSIPKNQRNIADEFKIKKRLKDHFQKHANEKDNEVSKIKREGWIWVIIGALINILVVSGLLNLEGNLVRTIIGIFEVPSWFLIWEGMGKIFLDSKTLEPERLFYKKMANCHINFMGY